MTDCLQVVRDGPVTKLTLNRPDKLNALDASLVAALTARVQAAATDGTRLLVFTGAGRGFSAGFDFSGLEAQSDGDLALRFLRLEALLQAVYHAPIATLALVHGPCFGAAADLVVTCGRRVATADAKFRMPGLQFGVVLGTQRLSHVVGPRAARQLLSESAVFDSATALATGFIDEIRDCNDWPDLVAEARRSAEALPRESQRALHDVTVRHSQSADMANLAASVAVPGLKERITAFIAASRRKT